MAILSRSSKFSRCFFWQATSWPVGRLISNKRFIPSLSPFLKSGLHSLTPSVCRCLYLCLLVFRKLSTISLVLVYYQHNLLTGNVYTEYNIGLQKFLASFLMVLWDSVCCDGGALKKKIIASLHNLVLIILFDFELKRLTYINE